jgi:hypothetical protein
MGSYVKVNVGKPGGIAPGRGLQIKANISLIDVQDLISMGERDEKGVVITDPFVMKADTYGVTLYLTQDTAELASNSDGDTDNEGFTPSLKFKHPGNKQEVREFKSNWLGRQVIVVIDKCDGTGKDLLGEYCNPCKLQVNMTSNKDATGNEFTFQQISRGLDIGIFDGVVPLAEPKAVLAAGATTVALVGEGEYQLTGHSSAVDIDTVTGASHGLLFTLVGANSATAPTVSEGGAFILKDGAAWTGSAGKQITFKAYKSGSSAYSYIEQSRV